MAGRLTINEKAYLGPSNLSKEPAHPKLRSVETQLLENEGLQYLSLLDGSSVSDKILFVPKSLVHLLIVIYGIRACIQLRSDLELCTGLEIELPVNEP